MVDTQTVLVCDLDTTVGVPWVPDLLLPRPPPTHILVFDNVGEPCPPSSTYVTGRSDLPSCTTTDSSTSYGGCRRSRGSRRAGRRGRGAVHSRRSDLPHLHGTPQPLPRDSVLQSWVLGGFLPPVRSLCLWPSEVGPTRRRGTRDGTPKGSTLGARTEVPPSPRVPNSGFTSSKGQGTSSLSRFRGGGRNLVCLLVFLRNTNHALGT